MKQQILILAVKFWVLCKRIIDVTLILLEIKTWYWYLYFNDATSIGIGKIAILVVSVSGSNSLIDNSLVTIVLYIL